MKKIFLNAIVLGFISLTTFAQDNSETLKPKSFIGVTGGYSSLMGNITKSVYADNTSGYASSMGYNVGLEGAVYVNKYLGIGGIFSMASFNTNGLQTMSDGYKKDFNVDSISVTVTTKYVFSNFFVGPYFSLPIKKFTLDLRIVGGLTHVTTPDFDVNVIDGSKPHPFAQSISSANAFGAQVGLGIRYSIIKNLCVKLNADYYFSNPDITIKNSNRVINTGRTLTDYHQPISILYLNLGLAYQFGK
jgi:hypothetical protein